LIWLLPHPLPPAISRKQVVSLSQSSCVLPVELTDWRGGSQIIFFTQRGIFRIFSFYLPPLRFHCVRGCWDRSQDSCKAQSSNVEKASLSINYLILSEVQQDVRAFSLFCRDERRISVKRRVGERRGRCALCWWCCRAPPSSYSSTPPATYTTLSGKR
jgi:hypothetical protein